jgi:NAD(P)-dependent dehydrogenase (short-subunit alcohol dehydrogenase family)
MSAAFGSFLKEREMGRLSGKVALVTGAAQGIGATYALALAKEGALVCVSDLQTPEKTKDAIIASGGRALAVAADVTSPESVRAMAQTAVDQFGGADILVNNAALFGKLSLKPFEQITSEEWNAVMNVNVRGVFESAKAVIPHMRKRGYGKIVNVASGTVFKGTPMMLHYVTSKGAIVALTRSLAREVGADGVCVNCIAPGLIMSENVRKNPAWSNDVVAGNVLTRAIKREAEPSDLIGTLVFLCASDSDFMTGQTVVVDGGSVMH